MAKKKIYKTIDLCAGIGGIRRAFELTGRFENVLSAETDKYACQTYEHLFDEDPSNDVTSSAFKKLVENTEYDVLLAGFPCQPFSRAGKELGFSEADKGTIFFHLVSIIKKNRPKAIFLENVENLVRHDGEATFRKIVMMLEKKFDYKVIGVETDEDGNLVWEPRSFIRNSKNFGVPQNRPRVYIVAFDRKAFASDKLDSLPEVLPEKSDEQIYEDLNDVLEMGAPERFYMSSGYLETLVKHKERNEKRGNGFGFKVVNEPGIEHPIANTILATGGSGKERNLVIDEQDGIAGKVVTGKQTPLNDQCIRVMTPWEWGKLQGFVGYGFMEKGKEGFSFPEGLSIAQQYKQFGNAVTIPTVKAMAVFVLECLDALEA